MKLVATRREVRKCIWEQLHCSRNGVVEIIPEDICNMYHYDKKEFVDSVRDFIELKNLAAYWRLQSGWSSNDEVTSRKTRTAEAIRIHLPYSWVIRKQCIDHVHKSLNVSTGAFLKVADWVESHTKTTVMGMLVVIIFYGVVTDRIQLDDVVSTLLALLTS